MSPPQQQQQAMNPSNMLLSNQNDKQNPIASPSLSSPIVMVRPPASSSQVSITLPTPLASSTPNSVAISQQQMGNHSQKMTPTTQFDVHASPQLTLARPNSQLQQSINNQMPQQSGNFPPNVMITSQNSQQVSLQQQQRMNSLPQFSSSQQQHHIISNRMSTMSQNIVPNNNFSTGVTRSMQVSRFVTVMFYHIIRK